MNTSPHNHNDHNHNNHNDRDRRVADDVDRRVEMVFNQPDSTRRHRRWGLAVAVVVVLTVLGMVAASVAGGSQAQAFRTAQAEQRDVEAELSSVATIEAVSQAAVAFPASGTVAAVEVSVGDTVSVGETLASLDVAQLTRTLNQKKEAVAQAELALSRALAGESTSDIAGSGATASNPATNTGVSSSATGTVVLAATSQPPSGNGMDTELVALQNAVLEAQAAVDQAIARSNATMDAAASVCSAEVLATGSTATGGQATETPSAGVPATTTDACLEALEEVQQAQQATATAQEELAVASKALDDYLVAQSGAQDNGSTNSTDNAPQSGQSPAAIPNADAQSQASQSPSSAELVAYQKALSAAELQALVAQQAVAQARIVSPISGTVVVVGFEAGDEVTAASSTQTVTIQGDNGVEAVTTVGLSDVASVELGQIATVLPDGSEDALRGEVVGIAATPDNDSSTTSYRVTVALGDTDVQLGAGTTGSVAILAGQAREALAVPSSAITWTRGTSTVQVLTDEGTEERPIEVGVVGPDWIEVLSGIDEGAEVVLAELDEPLPGAASEVADNEASANLARGGGPGAGFAPPG